MWKIFRIFGHSLVDIQGLEGNIKKKYFTMAGVKKPDGWSKKAIFERNGQKKGLK
jgi:hypothetical protein